MRSFRRLVLLCLLWPFATPLLAAPLFEDHLVIELKLKGPLKGLFSDTGDLRERDFLLVAEDIEHSIEVRIRGNSRLRVCEFPPLRLNFKKEATAGSVFEGQDKLKLVTHCRNSDQGVRATLYWIAAIGHGESRCSMRS